MIGVRTVARSLLASIFVAGGVSAFRKSRHLAPVAEDVAQPIAESIGLDQDTRTLVQVNAGVQVVGGVLFALGVTPRVVGPLLGATLIPNTLAAHRFWEIDDAEARESQLIQFCKNAAIVGGLVFAALDTGGRPSVFWQGRRAAVGAADTVASAARSAYDTVAPD